MRFGRVLGVGARVAARTLVNAVDAATSPNPSAEPAPSKTVAQATQQAARTATQTAAQVKQTGQGLAQGSRRFGESFWGQVTRLSGVLWLEFTGVFFGIFALYGASGAWKLRGNLHRTATNQDAHAHFLLLAGMAALFGYFCVTSFLRAGRRGRRKA
ncbi:hypothetical protein [Edaphobacter bradus]|uniref:hypothetical protein n=1 Tax=Edaphobacter bradus TaxID=2259016 RepID=UPI0021DF6058|nr:hypothetical protein [Edaphobacter bradus]